ncbi:MAG: hypothetical protein GXX91_02415 [Verrucomicrobiaceae bacterium]|nr:hypothetical protein [Verrucomicrobiaceae bacterium]
MKICTNPIRLCVAWLLTAWFAYPFATGGAAEKAGRGDPFPGFSFTVPDQAGEPVEILYGQGEVSCRKKGQDAPGPVTAELAKLVPEGSSAEEINRLLRRHRIVHFSPQATYRLSEPIRIPSDTYIDFQQASLVLEEGANAYLLQNENQEKGDTNIILLNGRLLGNGSRQERNYTKDYREGYFGFGTTFTKVDQLVMDGFHVQDTNAWGIAYFLCGTVRFSHFIFDQQVARGKNGDGITGIAKNIYVAHLSGYTNDDMVAVSTGIGSLRGNDIGISKENNIDVENVVIENIRCSSKEGKRTHVGVGLYPTAGRTIKKVTLSGLRGEFDHCAYRLQNYWPHMGDGHFGELVISDVESASNHLHGSVVDVANIGSLLLERHSARESNTDSDLLTLANTTVEKLALQDCTLWNATPDRVGWVHLLPDKPSRIHQLSVQEARRTSKP